MRRGARWALGVGASLFAIAAMDGAYAEVFPIDLDNCTAACLPVAIMTRAGAKDNPTADVTLSLSGGGGTEGSQGRPARSDLRPETPCRRFWSAYCCPQSGTWRQNPDSEGVSPYAFSAEVITRRTPFMRKHSRGSPSPLRSPAGSATFCGQQRLFPAIVRRYSLPSRPPRLRRR